MTYIYDGTYEGLLTAVFTAFEYKEYNVRLCLNSDFQGALFEIPRSIVSNRAKSNRVHKGLYKFLSKERVEDLWHAFLSEDKPTQQIVFELILASFRGNSSIFENYGNVQVLKFHHMLGKVNRERHRMKAFVRFQKGADGVYVAIVEPDFNVLPLIAAFFKNRYSDQKWLIYDKKRQYGIYYDMRSLTEVTISAKSSTALQKKEEIKKGEMEDSGYIRLWQAYFQSTNIEARKNLKLHLQHVPKRYWKYLPEKIYR